MCITTMSNIILKENALLFNKLQLQIPNIVLFFFLFQLRKTVFDYAQRELAPKAAEIDKTNTFRDLRVIMKKFFFFKQFK